MKLRVEISPTNDDEIVLYCRELTPEILKLQELLKDFTNRSTHFLLYKEDTEFYIPTRDILFFETDANGVLAHTKHDTYRTKHKLYELEEILAGSFLRISKSAIVNLEQILSISRNVTASSTIEFYDSHKQIFVSRSYYKILKEKLEEKRMKR